MASTGKRKTDKSMASAGFSIRLKMTRVLVLFLVLVIHAGCNSGASKTEAIRRSLDPEVRAMLEAGNEALQRGNYKHALALADSVEQVEPEFADLYFFRGSVYVAMQQFGDARDAFQKVLLLDKEFPGAHQRLGDVATALGQLDKALGHYEDEARLHPDTNLYEKIGTMYADAGRADNALNAYQKAINRDSSNATAYLLLGQLKEQLGELNEALVYSRKALAIRPDFPNYQFVVGAQLLRSGQTEEAIQYLRSAADAQLLHYPAQYNMGQALMRLDRTDEARQYFIRADTARVLLDQINLLEQAAAQRPGQTTRLVQLAALYQRADMQDRAGELFNMVIRIEPGNLDAQLGLARLAIASGNTSEAIRRLKLILFADPKRVDALLALGFAHTLTGNCEEATTSWHKALALEPANPSAQSYLIDFCQ